MRKMFFAMIFSCCFFSITAMAEQYCDSMCYEYFDTQPMPQIADLKDIKIYGVKSSGIVVCIGNKSQYFDWLWQNSIYKLPVVCFEDIDKDGEKELCYIANLYQGVGTSSQQLYILDIVEQDGSIIWKDDTFSENDIREQLLKYVSISQHNDVITVAINDDIIYYDKYTQKQIDNMTLLYPEFTITENQINVRFSIAVFYNGNVTPYVLDNQITADIVYHNNNYQLQNIHFLQ